MLQEIRFAFRQLIKNLLFALASGKSDLTDPLKEGGRNSASSC
jgi:hypothetical protein